MAMVRMVFFERTFITFHSQTKCRTFLYPYLCLAHVGHSPPGLCRALQGGQMSAWPGGSSPPRGAGGYRSHGELSLQGKALPCPALPCPFLPCPAPPSLPCAAALTTLLLPTLIQCSHHACPALLHCPDAPSHLYPERCRVATSIMF